MMDRLPSAGWEFKPMEIPPVTFEVKVFLLKLGDEVTNLPIKHKIPLYNLDVCHREL
jgi:hypothetical protein